MIQRLHQNFATTAIASIWQNAEDVKLTNAEVLSSGSTTMEIQASAANALSDWQTFFASETLRQAKETAKQSEASRISKEHLVAAAIKTIERLKAEIQTQPDLNDDRKAA